MGAAATGAWGTGRFIAGRMLHALFVVAGVSVIVFVLTHLVGDPARLTLPIDATQEQYELARAQFGLDDPLYQQFADYVADVLRGDFGESFSLGQPAMSIVLDAVWPTLQLAFAAVALGALFGVPAGFIAALRPDGLLDRFLSAVALLGVSIANFWLALMLILIFAVELSLLPTSGYGAKQLILPALAAAAFPFGQLMQVARTAMLEQLREPYLVVARAKGLPASAVVVRHAVRNALISVVTVGGFEMARIMAGGIVIIEVIFSWPGVGRLIVNALNVHDFPLIQACILVIATLVVLVNLLVDLLYGAIDPRVRLR